MRLNERILDVCHKPRTLRELAELLEEDEGVLLYEVACLCDRYLLAPTELRGFSKTFTTTMEKPDATGTWVVFGPGIEQAVRLVSYRGASRQNWQVEQSVEGFCSVGAVRDAFPRLRWARVPDGV